MNNTYLVKLPNGMTCDVFAAADLGLKVNDYAILKRDFSLEYVEVIRRTAEDAPTEITTQLPEIQRIATVIDRATATENEAHAKSAYRTACDCLGIECTVENVVEYARNALEVDDDNNVPLDVFIESQSEIDFPNPKFCAILMILLLPISNEKL